MAQIESYWARGRGLSRRQALGLAAGSGMAGMLMACGRSTGGASTTGATQASQPKQGGTLNVAQSSDDPSSFDPVTQHKETGQTMLWTNDALLSFKTGSGVQFTQMDVLPGLAERWESPDAQTFTFHLRPGLKFANLPPVNGRALTSDDVKWTYEYLSRTGQFAGKNLPPSVVATMLEGITQVQTPDPGTAVVTFKAPFAPFVSYAASQWLPVLAHEIFDADGDFTKRAVGSGPFQLDAAASQRGTQWVYRRNPTYYRQGLPYADQVNNHVLADDATQNAAFDTRQLDILTEAGMTLAGVVQHEKAVPGSARLSAPNSNYYHLFMNVTKPPLNDPRIRQAINLCIDRDEMIKTFGNGGGQWALAGATPGMFSDDEAKKILKYDPAQAQQLVSQAGFPNGVDLVDVYAPSSGDTYVSVMQLLQAQLKKGNINLTLKSTDHTSQADLRRSGNYQVDLQPRGSGLPLDADSILYGDFYPGLASNYGRVDDPQLTPLLLQQRQEPDITKRTEIWKQIITRVNTVPWAVGLFFGTLFQIGQPSVHNYAPNMSADASLYLTEVWTSK
jgi:peptide/nickel transport system substrate-binding protein